MQSANFKIENLTFYQLERKYDKLFACMNILLPHHNYLVLMLEDSLNGY